MIYLRAIEREDLPLLKKWRNSEDVFPYVREYRFLSQDDQEDWYESYSKQRRHADWDQELMIIEVGKEAKTFNIYEQWKSVTFDRIPIGVGGFVRIEWRNRRAELSFYIGDRKYNESFEEIIEPILYKGFNEFNFNKITWPVYGHDSHLGIYQTVFNKEAILKEEYFWDGKFQDRIYLSLTKSQYDLLTKSQD